MLNIMLTGIGGQGTVLAAKVLAQAAQSKGWQVRTAETIGMAQRGGSVVSHVRIASDGEEVFSPLIPKACADMVIAFEPAEAARCLPYLSQDGIVVSASTAVVPVTSSLSKKPYMGEEVIEELLAKLKDRFIAVDEQDLLSQVGNRRTLNMMLLAVAVNTGRLPLDMQDLQDAVAVCVKPRFVELNLGAMDKAASWYREVLLAGE